LVEVNGCDVTSMTHNQAVDLLRCTFAISRFVLKRSSALPLSSDQKPETVGQVGETTVSNIGEPHVSSSIVMYFLVCGGSLDIIAFITVRDVARHGLYRIYGLHFKRVAHKFYKGNL